MSRKRELALKTAIISIGKITTQLLSFLLLPLYTNYLSPNEYGTYDLIINISAFLVPCMTLLMEEALFRFLIDADTEEKKIDIISHCVFYILFGIIVFSTVILSVFAINHNDLLILVLIYSSSTALLNLGSAVSRGTGRVGLYSGINTFVGISIMGLNVLLICVFSLGFKSLIYSYSFMNFIGFVLFFFFCKIYNYFSFKHIKRSLYKTLFMYSLPLVPNTVCWLIINLSDRLVVSAYLGAAANGIYSIATKFPHIIILVYGFFYTAWLEVSSKIIKDDDKEQEYNEIYQTTFSVIISVTILVIALLPLCYSFLIGSSYQSGFKYVAVLSVAALFNNLASFYGGIFVAEKDTKILGSTTMIGAIINLAITLIFIRIIGLYAAVISTFISTLVIYSLRRIALNKYLMLRNAITAYDLLFCAFSLFSFYSNNIIVNYSVAFIAIVYSLFRNKNTINSIYHVVRRKIKG